MGNALVQSATIQLKAQAGGGFGSVPAAPPSSLVMRHDSLYFLNFEDPIDRLKDITVNESTSNQTNVTYGATDLDANAAIFAGAGFIDLSAEVARFASLVDFSASLKVRLDNTTGVQVLCGFSDTTKASTDWLVFIENGTLRFQVRDSSGTIQFRYSVPTTVLANTNYTITVSSGAAGPMLWIGSTFYDPATFIDTGSSTSTASLNTVVPNNAYIGANRDIGGNEFFMSGSVKDVVYSDSQFNQSTVDSIVNDIYGYDVFALWGQSNSVGRPSIRPGVDDVYTTVSALVSQFGFTSQTIKAATNPLDHQDEQAGDMGMWLEFCNSLVSSLAYKRKVLLSPAAKGGTGFITNNWNPSDTVYEAALASTNTAMNTSKLNTLRAMHWIQGETDADNSNATYEADLTAMQTDAYARLTGYSADVPFICVSILGSTIPANVPVINTALQSFVSGDPDRGYVDATDLSLFDAFHYDQASLATIGSRSYSKFEELF